MRGQDHFAEAETGIDTGLNAQLIACWQAALHTGDPAEGARWIDMAHWLAHRDDADERAAPAGRGDPALLTLEDDILRGEVVDLSASHLSIACAGPGPLRLGQDVTASVRGWSRDRTARIVALEPGLIRLWLV